VYVWRHGDPAGEPDLYGSHMEEVRSGRSEEPERFHADPAGGASKWDARVKELGTRYRTAALSIVSPDGFPFAIRVPVHFDEANRFVRIEGDLTGAPVQAGLACLTAHEHGHRFTWQRNFQLRGDLVFLEGGWAFVPHRLVGGFELHQSRLQMLRANAGKVRRFRRTAKRELARRR
jgi:hypothetical protein